MGEVFSDWSENFSTEFKISQKDYSANRVPVIDLPHIRINGFGSSTTGPVSYTHLDVYKRQWPPWKL